MRLTKEIRQKIEVYCIEHLNNADETIKDDRDRLQYAYNRFKEEYDHMIERVGEFKAFSEWLQGLALDIAFYNCDILRLAKEWGQNPTTEAQEDKIISQYWVFMTNQYFKLFKKYKVLK